MTRIALVGCAHIHTPNFLRKLKAHANVTVPCVWDHDAARAKRNAEELQADVVDDLARIVDDSSITAAVVCSETNRHRDLVLPLARAGKHLFIEKPLGFAAADALEMAAAIRDAGVIFQTGYFMRGDSKHQWLKQHIDKGDFGKITRVRHSNCHSGSIGRWFDTDWRWMADPAVAGCGAFGDLGTHSLDILMWLMGDVQAATGDINVVLGNYGQCDESGEAMLKFENGAIGTLAGGWVDVANPVTCIISGTEGHAHIDAGKLYVRGAAFDGEGKHLLEITDMPPAWPHAFDLFLEAVTGAANQPLVTPEEAAARSVVMQAVYTAAQSKTWVNIEDVAR